MRRTPYPLLSPPTTLSVDRGKTVVPQLQRTPDEEPAVSVGHYLWLLRNAWWKIALTVVVVTTLAGIFCSRITPVYEATARLSVDSQLPNAVMGQNTSSSLGGLEDEHFFNTQIELIQTDAVLRPVAERYGLMVQDSQKAPEGMKAADAPVSIHGLTAMHPPNSFLINISYRSTNAVRAAQVANAVAHSFRKHSQQMRATASMEESEFIKLQLSGLKKRMDDSERALVSYETQMGVINPDQKTSILESRLQTLNTDFTQAQNDRIQKEVELRALKGGSTEALEVSSQSTELAKAADTMHLAQEKMDAAAAVYGTANPEYKHAASALAEATRRYNGAQADVSRRIQIQYDEASHRERLLGTALATTKSQFDLVNAHSVQYQELKRQADADKALYGELSRKVQEAGINAAFQGSDIRIADEARPQLHPVFPSKITFLGLGFFLSTVGSTLVVLLKDMTDKSLRDPMQARREIGMEVISILPMVKNFSKLRLADSQLLEARDLNLARQKRWFGTMAFYREAVRSLLTTIRITGVRENLRSVLITSATQGEGKSACIAHLAAAHARQGHRTLLIDADLRCPAQHNYFHMPSDALGLAGAGADQKPLKDLCQSAPGHPLLDVVHAGQADSQAIEAVGEVVERLLKEAYRDYDMIFIDAPPMLCFAETLHLASVSDAVLVMCQAGQTTREQVANVLGTLQQLGCYPLGMVLNQVRETMSSHYGQYQSYYRTLDQTASAA